jgi:hypothetical protein
MDTYQTTLLLTNNTAKRYANTEIIIIVAPEGILYTYETTRPAILRKIPSKVDIIIKELNFLVNNFDIAGGIVIRAITRIIPTTFIRMTMLSAIMIYSIYSKSTVFIPFILAYSSSKRNDFQKIKKSL